MKLVEVITNVSKENGQLEQKLLALGDGRAAGDNPRVRDAETGQGKPSWSAQPTIQE
jgi:hypothetical protein